jgi:hypothetical protein
MEKVGCAARSMRGERVQCGKVQLRGKRVWGAASDRVCCASRFSCEWESKLLSFCRRALDSEKDLEAWNPLSGEATTRSEGTRRV